MQTGYIYSFQYTPTQATKYAKYLSVTMDDSLTCDLQIKCTSPFWNEAFNNIFLIKSQYYNSLVHTILDYGSRVWDPKTWEYP